MRKFCIVALLFCFSMGSMAQTFTANFPGASGNVPGSSTSQTCFPLTVSGVGNINTTTLGLAQLCLDFTHPNTDELEIVLRAPDGSIVPISIQNGGSGNNYSGTCFTASAPTPIKFGTAPFTGSFTPEGYLGAVNNGQNANGVWTLCIKDRRGPGNSGRLNNFSLSFNNNPAPAPPSMPNCTSTIPTNSTCVNATMVCDFNGLCGTTSGSSLNNWTNSGLDECFGLQNNSFIQFVASATTASFSVWVHSSSGTAGGGQYHENGIQMIFFSGTCNSGPVTTYGCYPHILPYSAPGVPVITQISASGLTPGNTYYLMIDGFNNDNCNFTIAANTGVNILDIDPIDPVICAGESVDLTATGGNSVYTWSPATGLNTTTGAVVTATPTTTTEYTVTSSGVGSCPISTSVTVTVNPLPALTGQPAPAEQHICLNGTASALTVTGSGTSYQWYANTTAGYVGGTLIPGATSASYTPQTSVANTLYYYCVLSNAAGCADTSAISGAIVVHPGFTAAGSITQQPTCADPFGTITVTAPMGTEYEYGYNGSFQTSNIFSNLSAGSYTIQVRNTISGCESDFSVIITGATLPSIDDVAVTQQPGCDDPTGTITIHSPIGAQYTYSNGGAYQTSNIFAGLIPATTYSITVQDINTGCISTPVNVTLQDIPAPPPLPTVNVLQPDCNNPTGTIEVVASVGPSYWFSIGGPYQQNNIFTNLAAGTYEVTLQSVPTGCISQAVNVVIAASTGSPDAATASVTAQPTCTASSGIIEISAPLGAEFNYSIGGAYQAGTSFENLAPGTYNITVMHTGTGCISPNTPITVDAPPNAPAEPVVTGAQRCGAGELTLQATGVGTINWYSNPDATNLLFSGNDFTTNLSATTNFYVQSTENGCNSNIITVTGTIHALPNPNLPTTVELCPGAPNLILNPGNFAAYHWQDNSTASTFSVSAPGMYSVEVTDTNGCVADATTVVIATSACSAEIFFPGAFSPNGDMLNDEFGPLPVSALAGLNNYILQVYNRYGQKVFESKDPYLRWNGLFNGKMLMGNYTYYANYTVNGKKIIRKGNILLIR